MKNVLTVGAYERDNFGDLLFFLIIKKALEGKNCNVVPGSIVGSDMSAGIGEYVLPYHFLLKNYKWDTVYVVGGEIGGVDIDTALYMSLDQKKYDIYQESDDLVKKIFYNYHVGDIKEQLAYLPDLDLYPKNRNTNLVVNSVGGFEYLKSKEGTNIFVKTLGSLKKASNLSVRNIETYDYLISQNIKCKLVPDVVHALPVFYPKRPNDKRDYILFQMNENQLYQTSAERVACVLIELVDKYKCDLYLFIAGSARGHDSEIEYLKIIDIFFKKNKKESISIIKEENPIRLVEWIMNAKLWIGTSLHGRILSVAYSIPRVSLVNTKTSSYSKYWDNAFPFNVEMDNLIQSCEVAFGVEDSYTLNKSKELSKMAELNIEDIANIIYGN